MPGSFSGDKKVSARLGNMMNSDTADSRVPSRVVAAMIRFWLMDDLPAPLNVDWSGRMAWARKTFNGLRDSAKLHIERTFDVGDSESTRHAATAADMALSFAVLQELAVYVGMKLDDPLMKKLRVLSADGATETYSEPLFDLTAQPITKQRRSKPGAALMDALARLMASGAAHVENPVLPGQPPIIVADGDEGGTRAGYVNRQLGWRLHTDGNSEVGTWQPRGVSIGYCGYSNKGEEMVLFNTQTAFQTAKRHYSNLIPPGQTGSASWNSVYSEGYASTAVGSKRQDSQTRTLTLSHKADADRGGLRRLTGIIVPLEAITDPDFDPRTKRAEQLEPDSGQSD